MTPLFDGATEQDIERFASTLREKLQSKFSFNVGQSKMLHLLAELNGFSNWQGFRKECLTESDKNEQDDRDLPFGQLMFIPLGVAVGAINVEYFARATDSTFEGMDRAGNRVEFGEATLDRVGSIFLPPVDEYPKDEARIQRLMKAQPIAGALFVRLGGGRGVDVMVGDDGKLISWCGRSDDLRKLFYKAVEEHGWVEPERSPPDWEDFRRSINLSAEARDIDAFSHEYMEMRIDAKMLPLFKNRVRHYSENYLTSLKNLVSSTKTEDEGGGGKTASLFIQVSGYEARDDWKIEI